MRKPFQEFSPTYLNFIGNKGILANANICANTWSTYIFSNIHIKIIYVMTKYLKKKRTMRYDKICLIFASSS